MKYFKNFIVYLALLLSAFMLSCKEKIIKKEVILVNDLTNLIVGDEIKLEVKFIETVNGKKTQKNYTPVFGTSNAMMLRIENGVLKTYSAGICQITIDALEDQDMHLELDVGINNKPKTDYISGDVNITAGQLSKYTLYSSEADITWKSSNENVGIIQDGLLLGLREGKTIISALSNNKQIAELEVYIQKYVASSYSKEELDFADNIMKTMTLEQKVGQMFIGSASGSSLSSSAKKAISDYHLGNFIYMGNNCNSPVDTLKMSIDLQNRFKDANNGIPGFISIDQETGAVNRMNTGATRFLGNMALAATNDSNNGYLVGEAVGEELKYYGINTNLAPVMDVNNNPDNPIINNRSYGDNPITVSLFGTNMINGLRSQNIMSCAKHFPGHGNTSTDSHLDLPMISSSLDDLYKIELAPFIAAIYSDIDAIMTTHIVFTCLDNKYPATLSKAVLTDLLRNDLGYNGLIITDGMEMSAITKNYGKSQAAILAINAGADILCYTSVSDPMAVIPDVISAVNSGDISIDRINDAVRRILIKKLKYNLFDQTIEDKNVLYDTTNHAKLNLDLAKKAVTVYTNNFNGLDKSKNTIIMSSKSSFELGYSGNQNSFGYYCSKYLKEKGMENCDYEVISSITNSNKNDYINQALNYDQIVIAIDSANDAQISFVNELASKRSDIIVVALKLPYDYNYYENVNTFISIYDKTPIMIEALTLLMNGEYEATGVCPVKLNK